MPKQQRKPEKRVTKKNESTSPMAERVHNNLIDQMLQARGDRYGEFSEHANITQQIKAIMQLGASWNLCSNAQREALDMIAHKIGRIVNGDPNYDDSWRDIIGYSKLVLDKLPGVSDHA